MDFLLSEDKTKSSSAQGTLVLEDSIMQDEKKTTAGSKILENFVAPFDATVVERLEARGFSILGKTQMDEFGIGRIASDRPDAVSGAVAAVAQGFSEAALCNDLFGKIRRQAAEKGVCYIHPTYGTVSRYGLIPVASSMDQIGVVCRDLRRGFEILSVISGHDEKDGAMFSETSYEYQKSAEKIRIGIPDNVMGMVSEADKKPVEMFAKSFETEHFELPYFEVYSQVMYILSCAEISNNINRYDGIKFGYRTENYRTLNDLYLRTRTEAFAPETKLAAIMGTMVLSKEQYVPYYEKAMKIRRLIKESLDFSKYDVIAFPSWKDADPCKQNALYALAALAGLPAISFPYQEGSIQLLANVKKENDLFTAWEVASR